MKRFTVGGNVPGRPVAASYAGDGEPGFAGAVEWEEFMQRTGDANLEVDVPVEAGPHVVGVSFVRQLWEPEGLPQPLQRGRVLTNDQIYMGYAAVRSVEIGGPYLVADTVTETPSRRAIFTCEPSGVDQERACATEILSSIARRAFRRPVTDGDVRSLLRFFDEGRAVGSFEAGIQFGLERILVDPDFLLRVYRDPIDLDRTTYALSDLELASRLSFFLWSSVPDEQLLQLAEEGRLSDPAVLEQQVRRMLVDPRATTAIVEDFAAQWLNLRRVGEVVVDPVQYPHYDESLLEAFEEEVIRFVASTLTEDRSVHDLLDADYTFVNERLARHYGLPGIYGNRFRRVTWPNTDQRGGLLAAGALLATTSYPDRTSPVLRGKWLVDNIFGLPVPAPPAGVNTDLEETPGEVPATIPRATRPPSAEPDLRELPRGDRSAGLRPGELRRDRRLARRRRAGPPDRQRGYHDRRGRARRTAGPARAAPRRSRAVPAHLDRKAPGLRPRAAAGVLRSARGAADRARRGVVGVSLVGDHRGHRAEPAVHDAGRPRGGELAHGPSGAACCLEPRRRVTAQRRRRT